MVIITLEQKHSKPVTLEAIPKSNRVDNCTRWVIDAEGLDDGKSINSVQIQNLDNVLNYGHQIHVIAVVLDGQYDRFPKRVKNINKFAYNSFGTKETLNNICVIFMKCFDTRRPNKET